MKAVRSIKSSHLVAGGFFLVILWLLSRPSCAPYISRINEQRFLHSQHDSSSLLNIMRRVSMDDRTVIVTMVNREWAKPGSLLDLFLESFRIGDRTRHFLNHLIVVAQDEQALQYCHNVHPHCFLLRDSQGKSTEEESSMYLDGPVDAWSWREKKLLKEILELGYNLIFTEADVMWLRNPVTQVHPDHELAVACGLSPENHQQHTSAEANGGFFYMKSNEISILLFKILNIERILYPAYQEQSICDIVKRKDIIEALSLRVTYMDDVYFGRFCQPNSQDQRKICTIHANCCHDINSKVHDLKRVLEDWKNINNGTRGLSSSWRAQRKCKG